MEDRDLPVHLPVKLRRSLVIAVVGICATAALSQPAGVGAEPAVSDTPLDVDGTVEPTPARSTLPRDPHVDARVRLGDLTPLFAIDAMDGELEHIRDEQSFLIGRVGYEMLAIEAADAGSEAAPTPARDMLVRVRNFLGDSAAGRLLGSALAVKRYPAQEGAFAPTGETPRSAADRLLAGAITGATRAPSGAALERARKLFERLGDHEGRGIILARSAAFTAAGSAIDEACTLFDEAAEAFDRAGDAWSAASARESCVSFGEASAPDGAVSDLDRLELAADGFQAADDSLSAARARAALGRRLLDSNRGREALRQFAAAEAIYAGRPDLEERAKLCARGIADAAIQIAERTSETGRPDDLDEVLQAGTDAAHRAGSLYHRAWVDFERARALAETKDVAGAETAARAALAVFRSIADDEGVAECAQLLGGWVSAAGRHAEAAALYREAAMISEVLGEVDAQMLLNVKCAEELRRAGDFKRAGRIVRRVLEEGELPAMRRQEALTILGDALFVSGGAQEAAGIYRQALGVAAAPDLAPRCAAALIMSGRPGEAASLLEPIVGRSDSGRIEERLYAEALRAAGDARNRSIGLGPDVERPKTTRAAALRAGRLLEAGRLSEALEAASVLAASDDPEALYDAAAIAAAGGRTEVARQRALRAIARGFDAFLLHLDPDLRSMAWSLTMPGPTSPDKAAPATATPRPAANDGDAGQ